MKLRKFMFSLCLPIAQLLWGTRITRFPPADKVAKFLYFRLRPATIDFIKLQGDRIYIHSKDMHSARYNYTLALFVGRYDRLLRKVLRNEIKPGMTVLDLGANIGVHTLLAARLVGEKGRIFAFEPAPGNYGLLVRNLAVNGYTNVIPVKSAVSNRSGQVRLFLNEEQSGRHNIYDHYHQNERAVTVDSISLDEFFKDKDSRIDFIKMDIEGAEMAALEGMGNLIRENRNLKLITEFSPGLLRSAGTSPEEFLIRLTQYGFKIYDVNAKRGRIEPRDIPSLLEAYDKKEIEVNTNLLCVTGSVQ